MKRANKLQPLSRQHHLGLHVGRHAKECTDNPQEIAEHWQALSSYMSDMQDHFNIEDDLLVAGLHPYRTTQPEVASVLDKLDIQHKQLHKLTVDIQSSTETDASMPTVTQIRELANVLYDHIRFEERELLPMAEKHLTADQLNMIYKASPDAIKHLDELR